MRGKRNKRDGLVHEGARHFGRSGGSDRVPGEARGVRPGGARRFVRRGARGLGLPLAALLLTGFLLAPGCAGPGGEGSSAAGAAQTGSEAAGSVPDAAAPESSGAADAPLGTGATPQTEEYLTDTVPQLRAATAEAAGVDPAAFAFAGGVCRSVFEGYVLFGRWTCMSPFGSRRDCRRGNTFARLL